MTEKITHLETPVYLRYTFFPNKVIKFYADGGGFLGYLLKSVNTFERNNLGNTESVIVSNLDASNRRNQWTYGAVVGTGMSYRWGNGNFSLETKYFQSMANITNGAERFKNPSLFYGFYFLDDDLRLNNLAISVGYSFFLNYKVIKSK